MKVVKSKIKLTTVNDGYLIFKISNNEKIALISDVSLFDPNIDKEFTATYIISDEKIPNSDIHIAYAPEFYEVQKEIDKVLDKKSLEKGYHLIEVSKLRLKDNKIYINNKLVDTPNFVNGYGLISFLETKKMDKLSLIEVAPKKQFDSIKGGAPIINVPINKILKEFLSNPYHKIIQSEYTNAYVPQDSDVKDNGFNLKSFAKSVKDDKDNELKIEFDVRYIPSKLLNSFENYLHTKSWYLHMRYHLEKRKFIHFDIAYDIYREFKHLSNAIEMNAK